MKMDVVFTERTEAAALFALCDEVLERGAQTLLLLAADANGCTPAAIDDGLRALPVPVCGGVFPQLVYEQRNREYGFMVIGLSERCKIANIGGLSTAGVDFSEAIHASFQDEFAPSSFLILVDGLASQIGAMLDGLYDNFGSQPKYVGGGAGSLSFQQKPCIFSNQGMLQDHGQVVVFEQAVSLSVDHGWEKLAGPFAVTAASRNTIGTLDYRPAFEVYREVVEGASGCAFRDDNFFDIAKGFPFGMEKPDGGIVVRDPITHTGDLLNCVGEVPPYSVVYVLQGKPENLIRAAFRAGDCIPAGQAPALLVDCISRVLFLGDRFSEELEAVKKGLGERPVFGVLTLGEIANGGDYCLEFYNKTLVLAAW